MSRDDRLDDLVARLLEQERQSDGPGAAVKDAMWSHVERGVAATTNPPSEPSAQRNEGAREQTASDRDSSMSAAPRHDTGAGTRSDTVATSRLGTGAGNVLTQGWTGATVAGWKLAGVALISALVGAVSGAWIQAHTTPVADRGAPTWSDRAGPVDAPSLSTPAQTSIAAPPAPVASNVPTAPAASTPAPGATSAGSTDARARERASRPSVVSEYPAPRDGSAATHDTALARERSLLDMGRTALSRGDTAAAFRTISTLEKEFPNGQLVEEREVLAVQTLVTSNRTAEARRRAALFRMAYPTSPLLEVVEDAVSP